MYYINFTVRRSVAFVISESVNISWIPLLLSVKISLMSTMLNITCKFIKTNERQSYYRSLKVYSYSFIHCWRVYYSSELMRKFPVPNRSLSMQFLRLPS